MTGAPTATAVFASAGTGKTFVLSGRYIALLAQGVPAERILATTFTRRAAGEILSRVLERLALAAASDEGAARLAKEIGSPSLTTPLARANLKTLVRALDRAMIGTIDAFAVRMAGAFALELSLPPGWAMLDDEEDKWLRAQAAADTVEQAQPQELISLLRLMHSGGYTSRVLETLLGVVGGAYTEFLSSPAAAWKVLRPPTLVELEES